MQIFRRAGRLIAARIVAEDLRRVMAGWRRSAVRRRRRRLLQRRRRHRRSLLRFIIERWWLEARVAAERKRFQVAAYWRRIASIPSIWGIMAMTILQIREDERLSKGLGLSLIHI